MVRKELMEFVQANSYGRRSAFLFTFIFILCFISACGKSEKTGVTVKSPDSTTAEFKAYYTKLDSGADWESAYRMGEFADIMVKFSENEKFYFWRASSYLPRWETNQGANYIDQAPVEFTGDGTGLRWDKLSRHSHVRIIESSPSQVVIHWRYAPDFDIGATPQLPSWTGWVDEYYTVKSDKSVTRTLFVYDSMEKLTYEYRLNENGTIEKLSENTLAFSISEPSYNSGTLPSGLDLNFGASYTKLGYSGPFFQNDAPSSSWNENWQNSDHPDIVVNFNNSSYKWVFWRGANFVPHMVSDNDIWFTNEFNEFWNPMWDGEGECDVAFAGEPMNDKENRYSHVRLIENTPARVVVQWRYALANVCSELGRTIEDDDEWKLFSDFFFYIYPDGYVSQHNTIWSKLAAQSPDEFEWQESIITHHPGKATTDAIEVDDTLTYGNVSGDFNAFSWGNIDWPMATSMVDDELVVTPGVFEPLDTTITRANIQRLNLKDTLMDAITIVESGDDITYIASGDHDDPNNTSPFDQWNHWPLNLHHTFGELALNDVDASHSPVGNVYNWPNYELGSNFASRVLLTGLGDLSNTQLADLAKSWDAPPSLTVNSGAVSQGFVKAQRAYQLTASSRNISFQINASSTSPIFNPGVVIKDWGGQNSAVITLNGNVQLDGVDYEQGIIVDTNGTESLVLWFDEIARNTVIIEISEGS